MKNIFQKVGEIENKPTALIINAENFIQSFFEKALSFYGCQVVFQDNISFKKEELKNFDYLFFFSSQWEAIKEILNFAEGKTKILIALKSFPQSNFLENKILQLAQEKKLNLRVVHFNEVYGPGMNRTLYQNLLSLLKDTNFKPIFVSDFIYGLLKAMFGVGTDGKFFSFSNENKELGWQAKINLPEGLQQVEAFLGKSLEKEKKEVSQKKNNLFSSPNSNRFLIMIIVFLVLALTFPLTSVVFWGFFGTKSLQQAQTAVLAGDLVRAENKAFLAQSFFQKGNEQVNQLAEILGFLGEEKIYKVSRLFDLGKTTAQGLTNFLQASLKMKELLGVVFQKQPADISQLLAKIKLDLDESFRQLSLAESQFGQDKKAEQIKEVRSLIIQARKGVELLPELLGLGKKQSYLVLFQNNSELRPTGGFIGSYGLLTFEGGQLLDFEVKDVYNADGQLKGHVEPPADLKKYLGEAGWYLRDANWDPDFPSSATRAAWFFDKEMGRSVDGVMGIDLVLAQKILQSVGEIQLPDYQEKINADNFFERAEYYSEINFFPGSTQKQDFLGSAARVLFDKIKQGDEKIWFSLIKNLHPILKSKDFLVWLKDEEANKIISDLGWSGELKDNQCQTEKCFGDYLMVAEANVGVNKANFFLKRSFSHQVKISEGGVVKETLRLDYQNNSISEAFPAGRYKSYVRIYTPLQTELLGINIKNPLTGETKEVQDKEVKEEHNLQVFGFLLEVPIQENRSVEITYQLAKKTEGSENYQLLLQKQPGIEDQSFSFWFVPPAGVTALPRQMKFSQGSEGIIFNPQFNQDLVFEINLVK
jgi:hypothetical protein